MKFKKIASLCNKRKRYVLYDKADSTGKVTQWLGDSCAAYPLDGLPLLDEDSLCKMFDITEKQKDNMRISRRTCPDGLNVNDTDPLETAAEEMEPGITHNGMDLIPLMGRDGIIFIDRKYLSPLEDEMDMVQMFERKTDERQTYIAVKAGLLIRAVIYPVDPVNDKFISQLHDMIRECKKAMQRSKPHGEDDGADGTPQITWTEVDE